MNIYIYIYINAYTCVDTHTHTHSVCIKMHQCVCVYIYICIHTNAYTDICLHRYDLFNVATKRHSKSPRVRALSRGKNKDTHPVSELGFGGS